MAPIHFGSLVFHYQAIDVIGPFDLLNSTDKKYMMGMKTFGPVDDATIARAPEFVFHHIAETLEPNQLITSNVTVVATDTVDDCAELDCLLIGGSAASYNLPPKYADFIRRHVDAGKLLFTNCTGAAHVAATGILDGKNATVNHVVLDWAKKQYPKVKWTRDTNWVVDGNIWTGSGAVSGMDMLAHWLKENFGLDVLIQGASALDYEPRNVHGLFNVLPER